MFRAVAMHCCTQPSFMKALWALSKICGLSRRIFPHLSANIFADIFPNSCRTEIGRMSLTFSVHDPSSLRFGIMVITDFLQEGSVAPCLYAKSTISMRGLFSSLGQ